jgi:signal peptidase I
MRNYTMNKTALNTVSLNRMIDEGEPLRNQPRRPIVALIMSMLLPGFGQLYNGEVNKAIWLFLLFTLGVVPVPVIAALYLPSAWMMPLLLIGLALTLAVWFFAMIDGWREARRRQDYLPAVWQQTSAYALVFVLCNLLALPLLIGYVRDQQLESFRIPSSSMTPSVLQGDFLFADKRYNCPNCKYAVARGDLAVFTYPNDRTLRYIKRIIALPGDRVEVRGQAVRVNDQLLAVSERAEGSSVLINERYGERQWAVIWQPTEKPSADIELTVAQGQVFVLGDSRSRSSDSRGFGTVPLQDVIGKARQVWFSSGDQGIRWDRLGAVLQ